MKKTLLIIFLLAYIQLITAQNLTNIYGKIGQAEILYDSCEFEKNANAVVMFDKGESTFIENGQGSFSILYQRVTRIKVLSDAGIKWGEIKIPYYYTNEIPENVYDVEATTYNYEDGLIKKTALNTKDCHNEKLNENWMIKKFAIPNVKKGSVIEYRYKIESPYLFNLRNWEFQWEIPVLNSMYVVRMIPFYQYTYILQGCKAFDLQTSEVDYSERRFAGIAFKDMVHTFGMANVPSFNDEEFITSQDDYLIKIDFQMSKVNYPDGRVVDIMTTWPKLIEAMRKEDDFGKFVDKTKKMTPKIINPEGFAQMTPAQKVDSVINYVKNNFTWDKTKRKYATKKPADLLKDKFGSSADLNLFAIGLLNGLGIEAYPVLISTRGHGKIKLDYPFQDFFNYTLIVAKTDSSFILTDATDMMLANNRIPVDCINEKGLIIRKEGDTQWINLQTKYPSKIKTNLVIDLNKTQVNTCITLNASEYDGLKLRKELGINRDDIFKSLIKNGYQIEDSNLIVKNQTNYSESYSITYKLNHIPEMINGKVYVAPFLNEVIKNNPLKQKERLYPVDMVYPKVKHYVSTIKIPKGYEIEFMPTNSKIKNDQFELEYNTLVNENNITVTFSYFFKQSEYPASNYNELKSHFDEIINKSSERIVLRKI